MCDILWPQSGAGDVPIKTDGLAECPCLPQALTRRRGRSPGVSKKIQPHLITEESEEADEEAAAGICEPGLAPAPHGREIKQDGVTVHFMFRR